MNAPAADPTLPWGVWSVRDRGSRLGYAAAWHKRDGEALRFATEAEARGIAEALNDRTRSANVYHDARRFDDPHTD